MSPPVPFCSFCGKGKNEVKTLIGGFFLRCDDTPCVGALPSPGPKVFICDECVELFVDITRRKRQRGEAQNTSARPMPDGTS
jgi:hypothetical protein